VTVRIPVGQREQAAYVCLYRAGLSINQIASFFGRSTSVVWRRIRRSLAYRLGLLRRSRPTKPAYTLLGFVVRERIEDLRKLPRRAREEWARRARRRLTAMADKWLAFLAGEEEEPP